MYEQTLHVDEKMQFQVNGFNTLLPYYWPSKEDPKLVAELRGGLVHIRNENYVTVKFAKMYLEMVIPHLDEYMGRDGLCGHAGNLNKNCTDDLIDKDGTGLIRKSCIYPVDKKTLTEVAKVLDTWGTDTFGGFDPAEGQCRTGEGITPDLPQCDTGMSSKLCLPIKQAMEGTGAFAPCKAMNKDTIKMAYEACVFDVCFMKEARCDIFKNFLTTCQQTLGKVDLPAWRAVTGCPMSCPGGMWYSACMSGCQPTCGNPTVGDKCDKPCEEGCKCLTGWLLDTSGGLPGKCVLPKDCPCFDKHGSPRQKDRFWFHDNCTKRSACMMGKVQTFDYQCPEHSSCGVDHGYMDCICQDGYKKDSRNKCVPK
ncbi:hypothetical protein L596_027225 [Steinernema carpocapsae]|uniref:VWFD domain-containing protein n=1 Tax=Steinernema carpocapsae TaxID=34508 RepID=A0A4U5M3P0_STECR|nr:hypothetical protein L596_027225 [Steinernema carpocapsae]